MQHSAMEIIQWNCRTWNSISYTSHLVYQLTIYPSQKEQQSIEPRVDGAAMHTNVNQNCRLYTKYATLCSRTRLSRIAISKRVTGAKTLRGRLSANEGAGYEGKTRKRRARKPGASKPPSHDPRAERGGQWGMGSFFHHLQVRRSKHDWKVEEETGRRSKSELTTPKKASHRPM
jgi:hypothetical protein